MVVRNHFTNKRKKKEQLLHLEEVKSFMKKQPNKQIKGYQNFNSYLVKFHMLGQTFK